MKKWQKYTIIGIGAAVVLGLVIWGCVTLWHKPAEPIITAPAENTAVTTEPILATTVPEITDPAETEPVETTTPVTEPEVTHGEETQPLETVPETTHGEEVTEPEETEPEVTQPKPTEPKETTPKETQPKETEPKETQPKPTDPPKETTPKPTEPKETEPPEETQPKPTEPTNEHPACTVGKEHAYVDTFIKPTCTEQGYWLRQCTSCRYEYKEDFVPALGGSHKYEVAKVVDPTGISKGYTVYKCSACGHEYRDNYVDPLPPETIDIAALEEYGRQYAEETYGYDGNTKCGFDNNAGYFPPMREVILTMKDGKAAARHAVDYQYKCDIGGGRVIEGRAINVRFVPTGNPNEYLVYCFYGGSGV